MNKESCSYYIRHIAHTVMYMQDKCLHHYKLSSQQARLLYEIINLSKKKKKFGRKELEKALNIKGPSVTSLLKGLENKGLITAEWNNDDSRRKDFIATESGKELVKHMDLVFNATENQLLDRLTDEEISKFKEYLQVALENMSS